MFFIYLAVKLIGIVRFLNELIGMLNKVSSEIGFLFGRQWSRSA